MKSNNVKLVLVLWLALVGVVMMKAQTACDKLYALGVKYQQTMTVQSQKQAISYFKKAKSCYDSQSKQDLCDEQIVACNNIIYQLNKSSKSNAITVDTIVNRVEVVEVDTVVAGPARNDVQLSLGSVYLKFSGKGEIQKVEVTCNYCDWSVVESPEWAFCSKNGCDELVVAVEKNPSTKEERSGVIKVQCDETYVALTIIQEKLKKYVLF